MNDTAKLPQAVPTYTHDGDPANLEACALDALEWLKLALDNPDALCGMETKDRRPLERCVRALQVRVEAMPPFVFEDAPPKPRAFPDAVAVIVASSGPPFTIGKAQAAETEVAQ